MRICNTVFVKRLRSEKANNAQSMYWRIWFQMPWDLPGLPLRTKLYLFHNLSSEKISTITPASKDLKVCHAGPDPASSLLSGFRRLHPSEYSLE